MSKKICQIVTVSMTVDQFLRFAFEDLTKAGLEVHLICDMDQTFMDTLPEYVTPHPVVMKRGISLSGIRAAGQMYRIFRKEKFDLIQYSTPNASLYASLAGFFAHVPVRLYCQWGLIFVSFSGIKRLIFKMIEKWVCRLSTDVQPDSFGNLKLCREMGFYDEKKSRVVWNGSACGVNLDKFNIEQKEKYRNEIRKKYHISDHTLVLGFLGRLMKDKGCDELIGSFKRLKQVYPDIKMLFVGPTETTGNEDPTLIKYFFEDENIIKTGQVSDPQKYLSAMDIFVFPSYREGFGNAVIEAQAMGLPVVITNIPGPTDGIIENKTGLIAQVKSTDSLYETMTQLITDSQLRKSMGEEAVQFVKENFNETLMIKKIIENRMNLLR